jgi:hypothetical protein
LLLGEVVGIDVGFEEGLLLGEVVGVEVGFEGLLLGVLNEQHSS